MSGVAGSSEEVSPVVAEGLGVAAIYGQLHCHIQ